MKIAQPQKYLNDIKSSDIFSKSFVLFNQAEELPSWTIFQNED